METNQTCLHREKTFPLAWAEWDIQDDFTTTFYNCVFTDDFGPFKKGETVNTVMVDYSAGLLVECNVDRPRSIRMRFVPIPE